MALERIVAAKRRAVLERKAERPLARFERSLSPARGGFRAALSTGHLGMVLECKKASPSEGLLRPDFDAVLLAREYRAVADAISVVTDQPFFQGRLEDLSRVREEARIPVLCKDFIVDEYQLYEARSFGADAVLLMLSVLDLPHLARFQKLAQDLGMDALVEVHDARELDGALSTGASVIGINNRDLATLEVHLETTEKLAPGVPHGVVLLSESGIRNRADLLRLRPLVDGFLVGSSIVRRLDVADAVRELSYGRVKVCGLTEPQDARAAREAGAIWGGLIFAEESPRQVSAERADAIRRAAPLRWAGVFVNERPEAVARLAAALDLAAVQLHGDETPEEIATLRRSLPASCEVWKAVRVKDSLPKVEETGADRIVVDRFHPGRRGGTGETANWRLLANYQQLDRVILAGGLKPENAAEAARLGTWAVDVNSGVEASPGRKSPVRLAEFFSALRGRARS
jgi:indole-3-glycerol phosphate synthase / phosphoribosylanthranilate isomerase